MYSTIRATVSSNSRAFMLDSNPAPVAGPATPVRSGTGPASSAAALAIVAAASS